MLIKKQVYYLFITLLPFLSIKSTQESSNNIQKSKIQIDRETPKLVTAINNKNFEIILHLVEKNENFNQLSEPELSKLAEYVRITDYFLPKMKNSKLFVFLLNKGKIKLDGKKVENILTKILKNENSNLLITAINTKKINWNNCSQQLVNHLFQYLAKNGLLDTIKELLEEEYLQKTWQIDSISQDYDETTFLASLIRSHYNKAAEIIDLLKFLSKKNIITLKGKHLKEAMLIAASFGDKKVVQWIQNTNKTEWFTSWTNKEVTRLLQFLLSNKLFTLLKKLLNEEFLQKKFDIDMITREYYHSRYDYRYNFLSRIMRYNHIKDQEVTDLLDFLNKKNIIDLRGKDKKKVILSAARFNREKITIELLTQNETQTQNDWTKEELSQLFDSLTNNKRFRLIKELLLKNPHFKSIFQDDYTTTFLDKLIKPEYTQENDVIELLKFLNDQNIIKLKGEHKKKIILLGAQYGYQEIIESANENIEWQKNWSNQEINQLFRFLAKNKLFELIKTLLNEPYLKDTFKTMHKIQDDNQDTFLSILMEVSMYQQGKVCDLLKFLNNEKIIDLQGEYGKTVILSAAQYDLIHTLESMYKKNFRKQYWEEKDINLLFQYLSGHGELDTVKNFLKNKYLKDKFNISNPAEANTFLAGVMSGFKDISSGYNKIQEKKCKILYWLNQEGKINLKGQHGRIALRLAAQNHLYKLLYWLSQTEKIIASDQWEEQELNQLLLHLAYTRSFKVMKTFLSQPSAQKKLNIHTKKGKQGNTTLRFLLYFYNNGGKDIINLLKKTEKRVSKEELFLAACETGNNKLVIETLEEGVDPVHTKNAKGQTGQMIAASHGRQKTLDLLVQKMDVLQAKIEDKDGLNMLELVGKNQQNLMIDHLTRFQYNLDINHQNEKSGNTLLMIVASRELIGNTFVEGKISLKYEEKSDLSIVKDLIKHGAKPEILNKLGKNAYQLAQQANKQIIVKYFEELSHNSGLPKNDKQNLNDGQVSSSNDDISEPNSQSFTLKPISNENNQLLENDKQVNNNSDDINKPDSRFSTQNEINKLNDNKQGIQKPTEQYFQRFSNNQYLLPESVGSNELTPVEVQSENENQNKLNEVEEKSETQERNTNEQNNNNKNIQFAITVVLILTAVTTVIGGLYWYLVKHRKKNLTSKKNESVASPKS